jgi:hypothetical protein
VFAAEATLALSGHDQIAVVMMSRTLMVPSRHEFPPRSEAPASFKCIISLDPTLAPARQMPLAEGTLPLGF